MAASEPFASRNPPLFTVDESVSQSLVGKRPVLVNLLDGFVDGGQVVRTTSQNILEHSSHEPVVVFDHDQVHDYRSRRPLITFDTNRFTGAEEISIVMHKVTDAHGEEYLLLTGPEPDTHWGAMLAALQHLIERFDVRLTVSAHGVPMAVPHTRPVTMTVHGTDPELIGDQRSWIDRVEIPASLSALLELRLGEQGRTAQGYAVHVPHYIAQAKFPSAAVAAMEAMAQVTGLALPVDELRPAMATTLTEIQNEAQQSEEVQRVVAELERQYDAYLERDADLPSADEIGAEFERFLRDQDPEDPPPF